MLTRRLQVFLSIVVISFCLIYLGQSSCRRFQTPALAGSELSECQFLLKHSFVETTSGKELIIAAGRALEPHLEMEQIPAWKSLSEEEAMSRLEGMVVNAEKSGLSKDEAVYLALKGMAKAAEDPFTSVMDPEEYARFQETLTSTPYGGVGLELGLGAGSTAVVFKVLEGSPAEKAGVLVGDVVKKVDGADVTAISVDEVVEKIHGDPGTVVVLEFGRRGNLLTRKLERVVLQTRSVRARLVMTPKGGRVGWIEILRLKDNTGEELAQELKELEEANPDGLVLDLRDNMGGYVNAALDVCSQFLDSGLPVVEIQSRDGVEVRATVSASHEMRPMLVVINGHTASSAEIVTACLQDYRRALVVGERSFGKGSVQNMHEFNSGGCLKFTTARYTSPEGRVIDGKGLEPDVSLNEREILPRCEELWKEIETLSHHS